MPVNGRVLACGRWIFFLADPVAPVQATTLAAADTNLAAIQANALAAVDQAFAGNLDGTLGLS
jgi:hypothetical protein